LDFEAILKNEDKKFEQLKKIQPFEDDRIGKLFKELSKVFSDAEWFGRCIRFPSLKVTFDHSFHVPSSRSSKVIINPPYRTTDVEGDNDYVKQIQEKIDKFYRKYSEV